jgi:DNA replication protein DnaC
MKTPTPSSNNREAPVFNPSAHAISENQRRREQWGYAPNPFCPVCHGAGFVHPVAGGKPDYTQIIPCTEKDCLVESKNYWMSTHMYLKIHGITERLQTFDRWTHTPQTEKAYKAFYSLAYSETDKPFVLCYGATGNGKTHLCQALTKTLNIRGVQTYYYQVPSLMNILRKAINDNEVEIWVNSLSDLPGLVLDDFGSETQSDWGLGKLQEIIDNRWTNKLITAVTMNRTLTELQQISPRIYSRVCDQEISTVVCDEGRDLRVIR